VSKSGKLQKETYEQCLDYVVKSYPKKDKFMPILDSWRGQTNPSLCSEKFVNENDEPTCSLKIILLECTPICQPPDVYFYRQVKNYDAKFQNFLVLIAANCALSAREDCIKMHAFIHHQLQAPVYLITYAWYAGKLTKACEVFCSVNQAAFLAEVKT
jgi:hypothetical protein